MEKYIKYKIYNSKYGDMVPLIAATALSINVFIISKQGDGHDVFHVKPMSSDDYTKASILLYKNGEHYDAIIPFVKHCDQNWFHDTNRIKDVFLNTYVGTNKPNNNDENAWYNHRQNVKFYSHDRNEIT